MRPAASYTTTYIQKKRLRSRMQREHVKRRHWHFEEKDAKYIYNMALVMVNSNLKAVLFFGFRSPTPTDAVACMHAGWATTGLINRGVKLSKGTHNADGNQNEFNDMQGNSLYIPERMYTLNACTPSRAEVVRAPGSQCNL